MVEHAETGEGQHPQQDAEAIEQIMAQAASIIESEEAEAAAEEAGEPGPALEGDSAGTHGECSSSGITGGLQVRSAAGILSIPEDPRPPLIDNLQDREESMLLTSGTGNGKTWFILQGAMDLAQGDGTTFLGVNPLTIQEQHRVLILNGENSTRNIQGRLQALSAGRPHGVLDRIYLPFDENGDVRLRHMTLKDRQLINHIRGVIQELGIGVVIIDPLICTLECNENDNVEVRRQCDYLTDMTVELGVSVIVTHHHGKNMTNLQGSPEARVLASR